MEGILIWVGVIFDGIAGCPLSFFEVGKAPSKNLWGPPSSLTILPGQSVTVKRGTGVEIPDGKDRVRGVAKIEMVQLTNRDGKLVEEVLDSGLYEIESS